MNLSPDHGTIDDAIAELRRVDPVPPGVDLRRLEISVLVLVWQINIAERVRQHRPRRALRRQLQMLKTAELVG
jgi:hypothetical protein